MDQLLTDLQRHVRHLLNALPLDWLPWIILALLALVIILILRAIVRQQRGTPAATAASELAIDVSTLPDHGLPTYAPGLELHNVPVRLAVLVLAPVGRVKQLPPFHQIPGVFEAIVPGLANVVATHQPLICRWPSQLSSRGFANLFFSHVRLPGEGGKGTPWSAAAGVFKLEGQPMMAGMVFRSTLANNIGQTVVEREEEWLAILRTRAPE